MKTYIMQIKDRLRVKIGRSADPIRRTKDLQTSHPDPISLIGIIEDDIEKELHTRFAKQRIPGSEWFNVDEDMADWFAGDQRIQKLGKMDFSARNRAPMEPDISDLEVSTLLGSAFPDYKFQRWSHAAFCEALDESTGFMGCAQDYCEGDEENPVRPGSDMSIEDAQDLYDALFIGFDMREDELQEEFGDLQYLGISPGGVVAIGWPSSRITRRRTMLATFAHIYGSCDIVGFPLFLFYILSLESHLELMEVNLFAEHFQYPMTGCEHLFIKICFADGSTKACMSTREPSSVMC